MVYINPRGTKFLIVETNNSGTHYRRSVACEFTGEYWSMLSASTLLLSEIIEAYSLKPYVNEDLFDLKEAIK